MARPKKLTNGNSKSSANSGAKEEYVLPENFVPSYALPDWSTNISEELIKAANVKGSPGFDPGIEQARQVESMTALGMSPLDISAVLRIEPKLLQKYYKYELETAGSRINNAVAKVALQQALGGNSDMAKFWLKTRAGWKETKVTELTGAGGGPITFSEVKRNLLEAIEAEITDVEFDDGSDRNDSELLTKDDRD